VLRFFLDVTGKTKLQTNMQASSLLPHWNTYEARAMRVVISDLPAQAPDTPVVSLEFPDVEIVIPNGSGTNATRTVNLTGFNLRHFVDFKRRVEVPGGQDAILKQDELNIHRLKLTFEDKEVTLQPGASITINRTVLKEAEKQFERQGSRVLPPLEQIFSGNGFGGVIGKFIYNTVTTFFVGEKIMIQVPTWFFPAGAGPYSEDGQVTTHGYPNPQATFHFAEPVKIDAQQNFRVEIEIPESDVLSDLQRLYGPLFIWTVLDGYMTRDVQ
jgi:hypothetical protein